MARFIAVEGRGREQQPGGSLRLKVGAGQSSVGTEAAERPDPGDDDARILFAQVLVVEAVVGEGAAAHIRDDDI